MLIPQLCYSVTIIIIHMTYCSDDGCMTVCVCVCIGRGECVCETDECMCTAVEETTGLLYGGELCECDPIICYNQENDEVTIAASYTRHIVYNMFMIVDTYIHVN